MSIVPVFLPNNSSDICCFQNKYTRNPISLHGQQLPKSSATLNYLNEKVGYNTIALFSENSPKPLVRSNHTKLVSIRKQTHLSTNQLLTKECL